MKEITPYFKKKTDRLGFLSAKISEKSEDDHTTNYDDEAFDKDLIEYRQNFLGEEIYSS